LTSKGKKVGVIDLTRGEMGTRGTEKSRQKEADKATYIMNLSYRSNLDLGDSILENSKENQHKIIAEVRKTKPTICITGAPHDRHPDHGKSTQLVLDSLFYAGLLKIETDNLEPWRPNHILHYMQDRPFEPDFVFNISDFWDKKKEAMLAFNTQFNVSDAGNEPETYISSPTYFKHLEARARYFGHLAGFEFGEPLKYYNGPAPLNNLDGLLNS
jgi:bacillithiol biosynthesis deacetylase BshB1